MIYLDHNASTPVDPAVRDAMIPYLSEHYGNPSSNHAMGKPLRAAIDRARAQVAALIHAEPDEIVFTSGGTEANNTVIKGLAVALRERGRHIITSQIEHPAVLNPCRFLEPLGFEVSYVAVDHHGRIDPLAVAAEVRPTTILISIMQANNEVGTFQPIEEIAELAREGGILMHTDAAQSCGKAPIDVRRLGIDFLSIAGHKMYAPQGIGALFVRRGVSFEPLHHGAGHEGGRRAGTEPVANVVGLGTAADLAANSMAAEDPRQRALCDRLFAGLREIFGDNAVLLGHPELRLPNTLAVGFRGRIGADLLAACPEVCASTGAACHAAQRKRSDVLAAMNVPEEIAFGAVRFSVGRHTQPPDIDAALSHLRRAAARSS